MDFAKTIAVLLVACLVGVTFGQPPEESRDATKLDRLHEQRIEVYSELLKLAHARGNSGHAQQRKLLLVRLDAAKTSKDRVVAAEKLVELCSQYERFLRTTTPDDIETLLNARAERIEAELIVEELAVE